MVGVLGQRLVRTICKNCRTPFEPTENQLSMLNLSPHDLGDKVFLMLRNHGLLTVGATISDAFIAMYQFEAACMIQLRAQAGGELIPIDRRIIEGAAKMVRTVTRGMGAGALTWPGLLRKLDRIDPSFRT